MFGTALKRLLRPTSLLSWYTLVWPKMLDTEHVHAWLQAISGNNASWGIRFVVDATQESITHNLALPVRSEQYLLQSLKTFLPEVEVTSCEPVSCTPTLAAKLRMTTKNRVLDTSKPEVVSHAILSSIQGLSSHERILLIWIIGNSSSPESVSPNIQRFSSSSFGGAMLEAFSGKTPTKLDAQAQRSLRNKSSVARWNAACLIGITANNKSRSTQLLGHIIGAYKSVEAPDVRFGRRLIPASKCTTRYEPLFWPLKINVDELVGLTAFPIGNRSVSGLTRISSRYMPMPTTMPTNGRRIAVSPRQSQDKPLVLSPTDSCTHMHVLGPTGSGKSHLLLSLISNDIQKGYGVVVIDPKGDLITETLNFIPDSRKNDVIVLDPTDHKQPVGMNPLLGNQDKALIADNILSIFHKLYGSYFGPRTQDIFYAGLLTILNSKNPSLCSLPLLYTNAEYRTRLMTNINDPLGLGSFWQWFDNLSSSERNTAVAPLMNKLRPFLYRQSIRRVIGQTEPKFSISDVFTKRKVLLVNLAKGNLGSEASRLFGSLVVSQVWQAAQTRANIPPAKRRPVFLFIDEMQDYLNLPTDISDVLAQARSYGLSMTLAHQNLGQLPKELLSAVLANARSKVCFQLTHEDASVMAKGNEILTPDDFENLGRYEIYAKLANNGQVSNWISGKTLPAGEAISEPAYIRAVSRKLYGCEAKIIESTIEATPTIPVKQAVIGHKKLDVEGVIDAQITYRRLIGKMS